MIQIINYCIDFGIKLEHDRTIIDQTISHLRIDSRTVQQNDVFIARCGLHQNGQDFITQALEKGAIAIICKGDKSGVSLQLQQNKSILFIQVIDLDAFLLDFVEWFYDYPSQKMPLIGVTGTNGKTTITQLICQWSALLDQKSGSIGTLGYSFSGTLIEGENTTPDLVKIDDWLDYCASKKADLVVMEISSHGLALNRVKPLHFAIVIFSNLTRDHLDFHQTLEAYEQAKWSLFTPDQAELKVASVAQKIINIDDEVGKRWAQKLPEAMQVSIDPNQLSTLKERSVLTQSIAPFIGVKQLNFNQGIEIEFESNFGSGVLSTSLIGEFNASNLLLAFVALLLCGYSLPDLLKTATKLKSICGRMESFKLSNQALAVVDYAHTSDALEKALQTLKTHCKGQIWTIFGCGGNRDRGKRTLMAQVAERLSEQVILTDDNPREEDPDQIIAEIKTGFGTLEPTVIRDRKAAIEYGLTQLKANDALLIAGKGHEDYQIIGTTKYPFSDQAVILNWMEQKHDHH